MGATGAGAIVGMLLVVGAYATVLGLVRHNDIYYLGADLYHWWIELFFVAYFTYAVAKRITPGALVRNMIAISIVLGSLTLIVVVLGSIGLATGGGHKVASLNIWRLEAGRGYPILLTLLLFASLRARVGLTQAWKLARFVGAALLLFALLITLKRTMWLTFIGASVFLYLPKRFLKAGLVAAPVGLGGVAAVVALYPNAVIRALETVALTLTYNPNYTVEETLGERVQQMALLVPYMSDPIGYGFGAQFYTYWPGENTYGYVHYIHNLYVYDLLQLGYGGIALFVIAYAMLLKGLWNEIGKRSPYEWLARGAFAATAAVLVSGLTLISTHTVFHGLVFGLGLVVAVEAKQRSVQEKRVRQRGLELANTGRIYS